MFVCFIVCCLFIYGNGVFVIEVICKGEEIVQYKGMLMIYVEVDEMYGDGGEIGYMFLFMFNDDYIIDVNCKGNMVCWINYSCNFNCCVVIEESVSGDLCKDKVLIEVICMIKFGEEFIYNYGIVFDVLYIVCLKKLWQCLCGLFNCMGMLLQFKC